MSINPPERRASLQESMSTSNRAALAFYSHQRLMLKAISDLQRTPGGVFANSEIRRLASILQDVTISIENELKQAGRLVEDITNDDLLDTDMGKIAMQDPRTGALIGRMRDGVARAVTELRNIRYTSAIQPSYIAFVDVPGLQTILTSLGTDIEKARDILKTFAQTVTNSRQEWPEIKLASAKEISGVSADVAVDPITALAREWNQRHFEMDPYFLADLDEERIETYKATIMEAALSMFPPSTSEKGTQVIVDYEKDLISYFKKLRCPVDVSKLYDYDLPDDALLRWEETEKAFERFDGLRSKSLRLCVFGLFNEGKSSFINALVGKKVLFSEDGLATAWPIVVRHDKREKSPVLCIPSGSLQPFFDLLREHKFSQILDPSHPSYKDLAFRHQQAWLIDQMGSHPLLTKFEGEAFDFPGEIRNNTEFPNAVMDTVHEINQLVRICWQLCPSGKELPITSNMWPTISVEFAFFAGEDTQIELLDCPGSGETDNSEILQDTEMPDLIQETSLKSCLDGSFCVMKAASGSTRPWKQLILSARGWTERKPLAVYITHKDDLGSKQKEKDAREQVNRGVYGRSMAQDLTRVESCAPSVFINAHLALKRLGIEVFEKARAAKDGKAPILANYWPTDAPVFDDFIDGNTEPSLLKLLWSVSSVEEARAKYQKKGYKDLKEELSDVWDAFSFFPVAEHFKFRAIRDGLDRRQFRQLCFVRTALQDLLAAQRDLIDWTLRRDRNFSRRQSNYDKFEHDAQIQWVTWKVHYWKRTRSIAATTLQNRLEETNAEAKNAVANAIADAKEQMMMEGEMDVTELGGAITIESHSDRAKFLAVVYSKLLSRATKIQKDHVDGIREKAKIEWTALMHSLATEIFKFEPDFTPYPRDEIVSVLRNAGEEIEITVYNHLIGVAEKSMDAARLRESQGQGSTRTHEPDLSAPAQDTQVPIDLDRIDVATISLQIELMTAENLPFRIACASAQKRANGAIHLDHVTRSVAHGLDEFGFMFRPSIPVSVVVPGTVAEWVWDEAALPGDGATARLEDLEKNFVTLLVDPWMDSLKRDSEKTLDGTICKVRDIARVAVKGFLRKRSAFLDRSEDYSPPAIPDAFLHRLVTWHACSSVIFGMVDDLCKEWIARVDKRLLPEVSSSSKNQAQQTANAKTPQTRAEDKPKSEVDIVVESFARFTDNDNAPTWTSVRKAAKRTGA